MAIPLQVLIVEDSGSDAELILYHLVKAGYSVTSERVETAASMKAALVKPGWEIIISDYSLPAFSAPAALAILQESALDIPFIVVSGSITEETAISMMRSGASDYLMKDRLARLAPLVKRELNIAQVRRESEENFRQIFNSTHEAIFIDDAETGQMIDVNDTMLKIYGFERKEEVLAGTIGDLSANVPPFTNDRAQELVRKAIQEGPQVFEWLAKRRDGSTFWSEVSLCKSQIGGKGRVLAVVRDISERKQAENMLTESEEKFAKVFRDAPVWIAITDMNDATYVDVNEQALRASGFSRQEVIGHTAAEIGWIKSSDRTRLVQEIQEHGRIAGLEMAFHAKNGRPLRGWVSGEQIVIGGRSCLLTVTVDISERKQAEETLRKSEERWQFALEGAGDGIWDWNPQTNEVFFSRQWKAILGYEDHEIQNTLEEWVKRIHPADRERCFADLQRYFSGKTPIYQNEHRLLCKDGTYKWILDRGKVIHWTEDNKPLRVIGTHSDITERKFAGEQLRESEAHYRTLVEGIPGIIYSYSSQHGGLFYSSRVTDILGYTAQHLLTQPALWHDSIHPDDLPRVDQSIREAALDIAFEIEYRILDAHGNWHWFADRSIRHKIEDTEVIIEGLAVDISERKQVEERLNEQVEELRRWHAVTLGREDRILELKSEVNQLLADAGKPPRYASAVEAA